MYLGAVACRCPCGTWNSGMQAAVQDSGMQVAVQDSGMQVAVQDSGMQAAVQDMDQQCSMGYETLTSHDPNRRWPCCAAIGV